jgi:hypothetical protein
MGNKWEISKNSCGPRNPVGNKYGKQVWEISVRDKCGKQIWKTNGKLYQY